MKFWKSNWGQLILYLLGFVLVGSLLAFVWWDMKGQYRPRYQPMNPPAQRP
jgi:hypothetical protein